MTESNEQPSAGRTDLDERTDVFSLGCVVYEMLVGDTPAGWPGPEDARLGRFLEAPPEHRTRLDALPGRVEQCLTRALALRAADRFPTPGSFVGALEGAVAGRTPVADEELRAILERASELDVVVTPASDPSGTKLTMGSVEQAAAISERRMTILEALLMRTPVQAGSSIVVTIQ